MKITFLIRHPARVHLFRNAISELKEEHDVYVFAHSKEMVTELLELYDIKHTVLTKQSKRKSGIFTNQIRLEYKLLKQVKDIKPDLMIDGPSSAHISKLVNAKSIVFWDTEHALRAHLITLPFVDVICSPESYKEDYGSKHIKYPGYHELAYLHPNRFTPDPSVLDYVDADRDDKIVILRLVAWEAVHDIGYSGFSNIVDVVNKLESTGAKVVITAEGDIPEEVKHCQSKIPPHKMHDLMYYSDLFIGEGGTMAIESAVLGTPAILVSNLKAGVWDELENKYGLLYHFHDDNRHINSLKKARSILRNYNKKEWETKRQMLVKDKVDVTNFIKGIVNKI